MVAQDFAEIVSYLAMGRDDIVCVDRLGLYIVVDI